mgnify:CR=1 FL=1
MAEGPLEAPFWRKGLLVAGLALLALAFVGWTVESTVLSPTALARATPDLLAQPTARDATVRSIERGIVATVSAVAPDTARAVAEATLDADPALTVVARARNVTHHIGLLKLGIEHIASYSPEARGRVERVFRTLQDRLPKELRLAGLGGDVAAANRFIRDVYLPAHNARFAVAAEQPGSAFVSARRSQWIDGERCSGPLLAAAP